MFPEMFDTFSQRARQAVFAARWRTGQRGADEMCVEDLVVGLIIEDQGMIESLFLEIHREHRLQSILPVKAHISFFPSGLAAQILTRIEELLPHSKPVSASRELPISSDLKLAFEAAKNFQRKFQQRHIAPLYLLAAALAREQSPAVNVLRQAVVTQEKVLETLGSEATG